MNRRGFLGAMGGAPVAGPSAGQAIAKSIAGGGFGLGLDRAIPTAAKGLRYTGDANVAYCHKKGWAQSILQMMKPSGRPSYSSNDVYMDCDLRALKSVSLTAKVQISARKQHENNLRLQIREFAEENGLNFLGLSEDAILKQLKEFAGE